MYKVKLKILSILLIPVVLFSTTSFSIDKHLCMDSIYSISIFGGAEDCGKEMNKYDEKTPESCTITMEDCCENELIIIPGSETLKKTDIQLSLEQSHFLTYFVISTYYLFNPTLNKRDVYRDYSPPSVIQDILSLFQILII